MLSCMAEKNLSSKQKYYLNNCLTQDCLSIKSGGQVTDACIVEFWLAPELGRERIMQNLSDSKLIKALLFLSAHIS